VADRCFVPEPRVDVSYGRAGDAGAFRYMTEPTPGGANGAGLAGAVPDPVFSVKAGMYDKAQSVSITAGDPEAVLYYTTDGTVPTSRSKRYAGPIDVGKTTAIRAVALREGYLPSNAVCATYLIGEGIRLPVVSLVTDPDNLFGGTGIYSNPYKDWERPVHVELLETDGAVGLSQDAGIKIFGAYSRDQAFKGLALFARSRYGKGSFKDKLFPNLPYTKFESFVLRASGNEANFTRMRDALITSLVRETTPSLDVQVYRNVVLFVNGDFWGVTQMRDKINAGWIAQRYDLDPDKIDLLEGNGAVKSGSNQEYKDLISYVKSHDLSVQANYDYVASKMDVQSYMDWYACQICVGNADTGNIRFWKPQGPDGKWRWVLYDFCWGFWHDKIDRQDIKIALNPLGNGPDGSHIYSTALINGLLKNKGFRQKFIETLAYHINVTFEPGRVLAKIDELEKEMEPYMDRDFKKWKYGSVNTWKKYVDMMRNYVQKHPAKLKEQMRSYFHLSAAEMNALFPN
jgi:hypothetical protein